MEERAWWNCAADLSVAGGRTRVGKRIQGQDALQRHASGDPLSLTSPLAHPNLCVRQFLSPRKRDSQLENCIHQIGLSPLWTVPPPGLCKQGS